MASAWAAGGVATVANVCVCDCVCVFVCHVPLLSGWVLAAGALTWDARVPRREGWRAEHAVYWGGPTRRGWRATNTSAKLLSFASIPGELPARLAARAARVCAAERDAGRH